MVHQVTGQHDQVGPAVQRGEVREGLGEHAVRVHHALVENAGFAHMGV